MFAQAREANSFSIEQFYEEAKQLENSWEDQKKEHKQKYEALISRTGEAIKTWEKKLDHGNQKLRDQISEERRDLSRLRDQLKRGLAEVSAAQTVDFVKLKEKLHAQIEDITE